MALLNVYLKGIDELSPILRNAATQVDSFASNAGAKLTGLGKSMQGIGGKLSLGVTAPIVAMGTAFVMAASDLEETTSKIGVIFGEQATVLEAWASTASETFGQSQQQALDAAATFALFGSSAGLSGEELTDFSTEFVELASDLASFNNTSVDTAINALGSALRGESEPMRQFGVMINAATLEAKAFEMGLYSGEGALSDQAKTLATQALIMEKTTVAQGDFTRTSDGLANSTRELQAKFSDVSAELGTKLLPIALELVNKLMVVFDWFTSLSPTTQKWGLILAGVAAAAGPVISVIGTLFTVLGPIIGLIGGAGGITAIVGGLGTALTVLTGPVGLVVAAVAGLALAWANDWGGIKTKTTEIAGAVWETLKGWGSNIAGWWSEQYGNLKAKAEESGGWFNLWKDGVANGWETLKTKGAEWRDSVSEKFDAVKTKVGEWGQAVWDWFGTVREKLGEIDWETFGTETISGITRGILMAPFTIADAVRDGFDEAIADIRSRLGIQSPSRVAAREIGLPFAAGIAEGVRTGMPAVMRAVTTNNYFTVELAGGNGAAQDVLSSVQMLSALYG